MEQNSEISEQNPISSKLPKNAARPTLGRDATYGVQTWVAAVDGFDEFLSDLGRVYAFSESVFVFRMIGMGFGLCLKVSRDIEMREIMGEIRERVERMCL